ncbi:MAG: AAA family ATPase [Aquabacterium sp.]|uniref:AAA family ATPase n=1 Tax=Aquabacterium sp. TaxID=1872578 RepID=UPI003BCD38ED
MSVVSEIAGWTEGQPDWISDAVRRAFVNGRLDDGDIADLAALLKAAFGLPDPQGRAPVRLDPATLPTAVVDSPAVSLLALRAPQNLNAIGHGDGLTFEAEGLTIVYGYNGAGKSGYARALKKACRARNTEGIHPNVFSGQRPTGPASARLEWQVGDEKEAADWVDNGQPTPAPLSRIAVFDSLCARVFIDDQAEVAFVPYGLDVLRQLAGGMQRVQRALEAEAQGAQFNFAKLAPLQGSHVVGQFVSALKPSTDPMRADALAVLTEAEQEEYKGLVKLLREDDPAKQATSLRRFATRVQGLEMELASLASALGDEQVAKLTLAFEQLNAADGAMRLASQALQEGGAALTGTGTDPWQVLVESAVAFAAQQAYPEHPFPGPSDGSKCVLCQQPLSPEAHKRLKNFIAFLQADTQKSFSERRTTAGRLYKTIADADIDAVPSDQVLHEELKDQVPALAEAITTYLQALVARKSAIVAAAPGRTVGEVELLPSAPLAELKLYREGKIELAAKLEKSLTPEERKAKTERLNDLEARQKLREHLAAVHEAIAAAKRQKTYADMAKACNTAGVTKKMNELYEKVVTAELQTALVREFEGFGLNPTLVGLEMSGQRGARMQQLRLSADDQFAKLKPSGVLSEGEQRAIALASFLAEISIERARSGIVFDDPVSSLDHVRRERIAQRLALEAKVRQVVVFTHDLAFAFSLKTAAESHGAKHAERHVFAAGASKGHSREHLPFEGQKLPARVNDLRGVVSRARKTLEKEQDHDGYNDMVRQAYRRMRDTWELLVEDLLFNGAVKRFRRSVDTLKLKAVVVNDEDVSAVYQGMTRCSFFTHDGGDEAPPPLPSPDEFSVDVESLYAAVERLSARLKEVEQRRKVEGLAANLVSTVREDAQAGRQAPQS